MIANSAEAWLIECAAAELDSTKLVQLTFLDAYTLRDQTGRTESLLGIIPIDDEPALGENGDWAEHYLHRDLED